MGLAELKLLLLCALLRGLAFFCLNVMAAFEPSFDPPLLVCQLSSSAYEERLYDVEALDYAFCLLWMRCCAPATYPPPPLYIFCSSMRTSDVTLYSPASNSFFPPMFQATFSPRQSLCWASFDRVISNLCFSSPSLSPSQGPPTLFLIDLSLVTSRGCVAQEVFPWRFFFSL